LKNKSKKELDRLYHLWFDTKTSDLLKGWPLNQRDQNYYVNEIYEKLVFSLTLPENGKILVLGTHNCVSFDKLCKHFGYDRCIGFDLFNPKNHPCVIIKDCELLDANDDFEIAFCHNDIGSFWKTPELKLHCQKWASKNVVKGGYFLGNNNYNRPRIELEKRMEKFGFRNYQLLEQNSKLDDHLSLPNDILKGYMVSRRINQ
tara:strand:+ start:639 stop:1244 length:606 start_codon:yes stop_codon:yes gene_type:complete